ncbi:MAG: RluA family pseudouridine synthase [Brevinema sp.]
MLSLSEFLEKYKDFHQLHFITEENLIGVRLDTALAGQEPSLSRSALKNLDHVILVNQQEKKFSYKLKLGDQLECYWSFQTEIDFSPEKIDFPIIYQDDDLMIIDKPWGLVVHPAKGHESGTLANGILYYLKDQNIDEEFGEEGRIGIVHRLDKDTRGLMIIALNDKTARALSEAFKNREITKVYKALVKGLTPEHGTFEGAIGRSPKDRKKMAVVKEGGREARTDFKVLQYFKEHSLLACKLFTGRTHQIRVHFSHAGYPILNDELYSRQRVHLPGMALIACHLSFKHPSTGEDLSFTLPDPPAFQELIKDLEQKK